MDRVELAYEVGVNRLRRWRSAGSQSPFLLLVELGRLADGRWYAGRTGRWTDADGKAAYVFGADDQGEALALRLAHRWMGGQGDRWWPTPASFDARHEPDDGLSWVARGGEWLLKE